MPKPGQSSALSRVPAAAAIGGLVACALAGPAMAGPPYVTDDPGVADPGHWLVRGFVNGVHTPGLTAGATGLDMNYGAAKDLQLSATVPLAWDDQGDLGWGNVELAVKYRFLHQAAAGADVAFEPRVILPTSGSGEANLLLPVWAQKDMGPWSVFGGGGFRVNPGDGNRNFWIAGVGVTRAIGERWVLGGEIYHRTADTVEAQAFTGLNLGAAYRINKTWSILVSGGPGIQNADQEGRYDFYAGLQLSY